MPRLNVSHRTEASRAWPLLALALGASVALHAWLLGGAPRPLPATSPAWGRLEARLAERVEARAAPSAVPVRSAAVPRPSNPAPSLAVAAEPSGEPAAELPLMSQGEALVLPSAVRAIYRDAAGGEAELIWRLAGARYQVRWSVRDAVAPQRLSAQGSLAWSGLMPLHAARRDALSEDIELDWSAWRTRGSREAPLRAGTTDLASLLMQVAVAHQWLSPAVRRAGWSLPVLGAGWVRLAEVEPGPDAAPHYRLTWSGAAEPGSWGEIELSPELAYLPVRLTESGRSGGRRWQLAHVEDLFVE